MLLSACLIAKNESLTLERCLTSLQGLVDEVILVDTGSTDNTVDIALSHGAKVYHFTWDDDFSHARNEAIRHASGDWILVIDADEYVDEEKKVGFRDYLESTLAEGIFISIINYLGSLSHITKAMPIRVMRVFRNRHLYEGAVHEQIATSVFRSGKPVDTQEFVLHHVGYTEEFVKQRGKSERNLSLLTKLLEEAPDDLFTRSNLMAEYIIKGEWPRCLELAEETFGMILKMPMQDWPNFASRVHMHWTMALWQTNHCEKALTVAKDGIRYFPWYTDIKKQYASMLLDNGQWFEAKAILEQCRDQGDTKSGLVEFTEGVGTYLAAHDLGVVWTMLGDDLVARRWFLQSFMENPSLEQNIIPLIAVLPHDEQFLNDHIETKITDPNALATYVEGVASFGVNGCERVIERVVARHGISEASERAWASVYARQSRDALVRHVERGQTFSHWFWLGLFDLNSGDLERATESLLKAGPKGHYVLQIHQVLENSSESTWGIHLLIRDIAAMGLSDLMIKWLPRTVDHRRVWAQIKHSAIRFVLPNVVWSGRDVIECEQNALNAFHRKDWTSAEKWLGEARHFTDTVTQVLLGCDLALARGQIDVARKVVYDGKRKFPESESIKTASNMVHPQVDPVQLFQELKSKQSERGVLH